MAQLAHVLLCLTVMTAVWSVIGLPLATRLFRDPHAWLWSPALGWAVTNAVSLPLFEWIGMSSVSVFLATAIFVGVAVLDRFRNFGVVRLVFPPALLVAVAAAGVLALAPMAGLLPKVTPDGVTLASPIFDHSKIALVDEMIRSGVPANNPFFSEAGTPLHVAYYYLWHFSAAVAAVLTGVSGWEADAALSWFTAFASLLAMIALALHSGARTGASVVVVILASTGSLRTLLNWIWPAASDVIGELSGFGGWLFQTSWAPQHMASAMCVVMACVLLPRLAQTRDWIVVVAFGLVAAAGFQSSVWVGGLVFGLAALSIGALTLWQLGPRERLPFIGRLAVSAVLALALVAPFILDQLVSASLRGHAPLVALSPVSVLGTAIPDSIRRVLDLPAFWLVYLPVAFPAFYLAGLIGLWSVVKARAPDFEGRLARQAMLALLAVSLVTSWLLASIIGDNNDLGWRAVLPAVMILIALATTAVSRLPSSRAYTATVLVLVGFALSLPETSKIVGENLMGLRKPSERIFAATPALWEAVRKHTTASDRIINNPLFLADMTPWPVNISWALLANRRSCYAGLELAIPFAPVPAARRNEIETQFIRLFAGESSPGEVEQLTGRFRCDVAVVTAQDGAWRNDPFASSKAYRLVESRPDAWRIYRRSPAQP